ncbi:MAG: universal stress protein [Chloroflexi bacterium]|jgi:nucleotide-binding universal stress UspA family protein|nr:universal stress protein [Chloroflexota bacterium]
MYDRILVPLDGSEASEVVIPYVEEIAAKSEGEIVLVSVSEIENAELDHVYRPYLDQLTSRIQSKLEDWGEDKRFWVSSDCIMGNAAAEIVRYADENDMNLIAMAAKGSSGTGPWLLGNIVAKVLRATGKPVLLIRKPASDSSISQRTIIKRVLVPLDGSEFGEGAIPHVKALARVLDIEILLLHVVEPVVTAGVAGLASVTFPTAKEEASRLISAIDYLNEVENELKNEGLTVSSESISGSAAEQIITYSEENGIDLIAMSTHGRSGIGRWVFGSVTDKVLHAGNVSVLTVRASAK